MKSIDKSTAKGQDQLTRGRRRVTDEVFQWAWLQLIATISWIALVQPSVPPQAEESLVCVRNYQIALKWCSKTEHGNKRRIKQ